MSRRTSRVQEVERVRRRLEFESTPRLQMMLIVAITGGAGFIASSLLLRAGMVAMWSRYLVAFSMAYLVFLLLLWLWMQTSAPDFNRADDLLDVADTAGNIDLTPGFDAPSLGDSPSFGDALDGADAGEGCLLPLALIAMLAGLLVSAYFVVEAAPVLFAELIVDGVLSASLYRRMRGLETDHWLMAVLRRTFLPFVLTAVLVSLAGWELARYAPGARTLGEVMHGPQARRA